VEENIDFVGKRVRQWRKELGLSLQDLAGRSDVAASTIQKVEKGQMVPSIAVVMKIARGLDRRPTELVTQDSGELDTVLMRAKEHPVIGTARKMRIERLSGDLFDPAIEMWRVTVHPGVGSGEQPHAYEGEEVVVCEEGEILFRVADEDYRLMPGDSLHFKAGLPHRWWNPGDSAARFLIAGNFPRGLRSKLHEQMQKTTQSRT
jgi:transcriptional regulator with XRE-family HTH domain